MEIANPKGIFFIQRGEALRDEKISPRDLLSLRDFAISKHPEQCLCSSISIDFNFLVKMANFW